MIYDEIAMNNGVIFQRTYDILNKKMRQGISNMLQGNKGIDGQAAVDAALLVPVVVNCSFACELFLKAMLPQGTKGHKLDELFMLLDNNIQDSIRQKTIDQMKTITPTYSDTDFYANLAQNSNQFADWRYFHEKNNLSVGIEFLSRFMKSLFSKVDEERNK